MRTLTIPLTCIRCHESSYRTLTLPDDVAAPPSANFICVACGVSEPGKFESAEHAENYVRKVKRRRHKKVFCED
jgi:hypothetical protein